MARCAVCGTEGPAGARFCPGCGAALGAPALSRRRIATVLFCDVVDSTAAAEGSDAESVLQIMLRYFEAVRGAIERHGGTVEKFIGDAVVGMFGVPVAHDDDALRAVRAAVEAQERVAALGGDLERAYGHTVMVRIGVNTGEVATAADPVSGGPLVIADAINVAARLQQAAGPGEIVLGEQTHRLVRGNVLAEALPPVEAKGKARPLTAHRLRRLLDAPASFDRYAGPPLVGREREIAVLRGAYDETVADRRCRIATVVGDAGVGKSRLAHELAARLAADATAVYGATPSYGDGVTYRALGQALRHAAGCDEDDPPDSVLAKLAALAGGGPDGRRVADTVGQALGLCNGTATGDEISAAVRDLLEATAAARPLVAILDDVHWAEPAFLDLLWRMVATARAPVLLVCLARPDLLDERSDWPVTVALEPLGEADSARLLRDLLDADPATPAPEAAAARIAAAAQGNPLFLEQLAAMVADEDGAADPVALPPSLSVLLTARLDRLTPTERAVAERAAVEGVTFHEGAVATLCADECSSEAVHDAIGVLVARQFAEPAAALVPGQTAHRFRHVLVRDAAYAGASKLVRAGLHETYAAWLEAHAPGQGGADDETLGHHLEQAYRLRGELGRVDAAGRALGARAGALVGAAGRRTLARGEVATAARLLERAAGLLPEGSAGRAEATCSLGIAATELGDLGRAERLFAEVASGTGAGGDVRLRARARLELTWVREIVGAATVGELRGTAEEVIRVGAEHGDDLVLARAFFLVGTQLFTSELHAQAVAALDRALEHARRAGDGRVESDALYFCGCGVYFGPTPAPAATPRWEALLRESAHRPAVEAAAATGLALLLGLRGQFGRARALIERTFAIYDELGMAFHRAGNLYSLTEIEMLAGDWGAAEATAREGYERLLVNGDRTFASGGAAYLAEIAEADGRHDEVEGFVAAAEQLGGPEDIQTQSRVLGLRATVLARQGRHEEALSAADAAEALLAATESPGVLAQTLLERATALRLAARPADADAAVRRALDLYERKGNIPRARSARALLGAPAPARPAA